MAADRWTMKGCFEIIRPPSVTFQRQLQLPVKTFKRSAIRIRPEASIFLIKVYFAAFVILFTVFQIFQDFESNKVFENCH